MHFIDVAVPVPLRRTFTYRAETELQTGVRVRVPFGNRQLTGIVIGAAATPRDTSVNIKDIEEILDTSPVLAPVMVRLAQWLWQYYHHSPGEVLHTMLPVKIRKGEKTGPDEETYLVPSAMQAEKGSLERAPKQQSCLHDIQTRAETKRVLTQRYSAAVISALKEKGLITESRHTPGPQPQRWLDTLAIAEKPVPDKEQAVAVAALTNTSGFSVSLLEGVTGSGKTEVYLQTIESILKNGRQVLILVPEIGLTPQTVARFQERFSIDVGVLHSQLNDRQRLRVWQQAKDGELGLIIGTRSAIFTPLKFPGMLIVDEEHDESYKQQDGVRYHARDLAVMRAKEENIPLVLGTATPSLESLNNALAGRYAHLTLSQRAGGASATNMHLLDIRDQVVNAGLADGILPVMRRHLEQGNQVLVFINRRGFAPALLCHHCGYTMHCSRCDRPYTVHRAQNVLQCHHCAGTRAIPKQCEQCHSQDMVTAGVGTEQVEGALAHLFPDAPQVRIDSDAVRGKDKLQHTLNAINRRDYQLLIGTQILSKGHHFPHVTLVVVLDCDGALFSGDFRASEKLGQLVTQLAGRAGRASKPGEMWLQTHNPDHPLLLDLIHNGYAHFARHELTERKAALLPPHASQIVIRAEAGEAGQAFGFLNQCKAEIHRVATHNPPAQAGPLPGLIEKRQGRYRFMLVLTHAKRAPLHEALRLALPGISALPEAGRVRWSVDVDPTDFS
ncbi:primosomal protein N' [Alteromonas halophila]|uniref:Replication restart protein PriA n=1 Tax=Alteromonas halophila TaxID=516698 RepID=A0A918MYT9_9ALTE|nr:primosomal protein N' [Alteromonas halophila]GGW82885.1 primosomal protein N' [Alteromonas halophila]